MYYNLHIWWYISYILHIYLSSSSCIFPCLLLSLQSELFSKYDICIYTKYFALVSYRTRICIYDKILECAMVGGQRERARSRKWGRIYTAWADQRQRETEKTVSLSCCPSGKGDIDADKDNDIDTSSHAIQSEGAQPRGGHKGGQSRLRRDKQSRQRVREGKEEAKEAKEAEEDDENLTAFFVKTFACLQIWWCPAALPLPHPLPPLLP